MRTALVNGTGLIGTSVALALAARKLGIVDVPLICAQELDIEGAMPRVVRILAHIESDRSRAEISHVYLGAAAALRRDIAQ